MMIEDLSSMEPVKKPEGPTEAERLAQFAQANASLALEGMRVDEDDLAIQQRVASGELTPDEAVALYLQRARKGAA